MRSVRSLLQIVGIASFICSCGAQLVKSTSTDPQSADGSASPTQPAAAAIDAGCAEPLVAERSFYEAQRLYKQSRFDEAAPTYLISYEKCRQTPVLCAAGQAYFKAAKCEKAALLVQKCLTADDLQSSARIAGAKLLVLVEKCRAPAQAVATGPRRLRDSGSDDPLDAAAPPPAEPEAPFAQAQWTAPPGPSK
ncbi:MAG: hypothetical protein EXR77_19620 [Myxococcales bacterium]|nr:hypothetical protein [Myxococcales bacterium]